MNSQKIKYSPSSDAELVPFLLENKKTPLILVVPGGGYNHYGSKEQDAVAKKFNSLGFHSAVLYYTLAPTHFPKPLEDLARAMLFIRKKSEQWNIDGEKIILCGFSAGGHLAASLGCWWNSKFLQNAAGIENSNGAKKLRPDALCLCYPVVTADEKFCNEGSIRNLIDRIPDESPIIEWAKENFSSKDEKLPDAKTDAGRNLLLRNLVSVENHIQKEFPRTFVWHTQEDSSVPVENTLMLAAALQKKKIEFEYHVFQKGKHGLSLAEETPAAVWVELFTNWLKTLNLS